MHKSPIQIVTNFKVSAARSSGKKFDVTAIVVPHVTCNLPLHSIPLNPTWNHLSNLYLADPKFAHPGKIDLLLGVDIFVTALLTGRHLDDVLDHLALLLL